MRAFVYENSPCLEQFVSYSDSDCDPTLQVLRIRCLWNPSFVRLLCAVNHIADIHIHKWNRSTYLPHWFISHELILILLLCPILLQTIPPVSRRLLSILSCSFCLYSMQMYMHSRFVSTTAYLLSYSFLIKDLYFILPFTNWETRYVAMLREFLDD